MNPTHNYQCTICGYRKGIIVQLPYDHRICLGCMGLAIGKLQNAVYNHRPTNTNMQTAIDDAVRPLAERRPVRSLLLPEGDFEADPAPRFKEDSEWTSPTVEYQSGPC